MFNYLTAEVMRLYNREVGATTNAHSRCVLITGASSGIGRALAQKLANNGDVIIACGRDLEKLKILANESTGLIVSCQMDVTSAEAVTDAITNVESNHGTIDVAVLNAGDYRPMPAAKFDLNLCRHLMEVNYMGVVNCVSAILPGMLERKSGELLLMSSVAGYRGLPMGGPYGASKSAVCVLAESLRAELQDSGVAMRVINPGFVKTPLTDKNNFAMPALISPEIAAQRIAAAIGGSGFEITFPRRFTYVLKLLRTLPYFLWFPLIRRATGLSR